MVGFCFDSTWDGDSIALTRELLLGIEHRGKDATGCAWFGRNDGVNIIKDPIPASEFVKTHLPKMGQHATTVLAHTRWETQGDKKYNRNNHPVAVGDVGSRTIGVHNGMISNDRGIHKKLTEDYGHKSWAEVDSEALIAYVHYMGYTKMGGVDGSFAAGIIKEQEPNRLLLLRGTGSPLMAGKCKYGWVFASEAQTLRRIEELVGGFEVDEDKDSEDFGKTFVREFDSKSWALFDKGSIIDGGDIDTTSMEGWRTGYSAPIGYTSYAGTYGRQAQWGEWDDDAWWRAHNGGTGVLDNATVEETDAEMATVTELSRGKGHGSTTKEAVRIPTGTDSDADWSDALTRKLGEAVRDPAYEFTRVESDNNVFEATFFLKGEQRWVHIYQNGWIKTDSFARPFLHFDQDSVDIYEVEQELERKDGQVGPRAAEGA